MAKSTWINAITAQRKHIMILWPPVTLIDNEEFSPRKSPIISASTNIKRRQVTSSATIAPGCSGAERRVKREKDGERGTWTRGQTDRRGRETDRVFSSLFSLVAALRNTSVQNVYALHFWWCHKRCHGFSKVFSFRWTQQNLPVWATVS